MGKPHLATMRAGYREAKRVIKHGPSYLWRRYIGPARIVDTEAIHTETAGDVTVCVVTSRKDWQACLWALVSFYKLSGLRLPLLIYSDGTLAASHIRRLASVFPEARIVTPAAAEPTVSNALSGYPNCMRYRSVNFFARRNLDLPILCGSPFMLGLDSDVFFLKRPEELIRHLETIRPGRFVFLRDFQDAYFASRSDIRKNFDVDIAPQVNCGITLVDVSAFDFPRLEHWLGKPGVLNHIWAEQALWAMYAGRERTQLLSREYDVSMSPHIEPRTVVKHYIGPIRDFMYTEGIPHLVRCLEPRPSQRR